MTQQPDIVAPRPLRAEVLGYFGVDGYDEAWAEALSLGRIIVLQGKADIMRVAARCQPDKEWVVVLYHYPAPD